MKTWSEIDESQDGLKLIKLIQDITHKRDETAQAMLDVVRANKELMLCIQSEHMSLASYLAEFKARVEVIKGAGGKPGLHGAAIKLVSNKKGLTLDALNTSRADAANKKAVVTKEATNRYLAALHHTEIVGRRFGWPLSRQTYNQLSFRDQRTTTHHVRPIYWS